MPLDRPGEDFAGAQSVERSMALLMTVAKGHAAGASLGDVVAATGLKQPTARRLLLALIRAGLIEQDDASRRYFLGPECYVLGTIATERYGVHRLAMDSLQRLAKMSQDTAFITVRNGLHGVCLERQEGTYPIRSYVLSVGDRFPLGVSAGTLAILAALPDAEIELVLRSYGKAFAERYPLLTREVICGLIGDARRKGYALNPGLVFPGSWGIGVAIHDAHGDPIAALSIAAIESRMTEDHQAQLAPALSEEARLIETRLHEIRSLRTAVAPLQRRQSRYAKTASARKMPPA